jgi:hypothetical protein
MPYKANELRRHRNPKARYKAVNWAEYDAAAVGAVRVTPEANAAWMLAATGRRGRLRDYWISPSKWA